MICLLPVFAQGSKEDYQRALSFPQRTENRVFRSQVRPQWMPGGTQFRYRIQTGPESFEWVQVDAEKGTRTGIQPPSDAEAAVVSPLGKTPRRSRRTGEDSALIFVNQTAQDVELFWLDEQGERRSYGRIRPGSERRQHTFAGHVWLLTDPVGTLLSVFEAKSEPARALVGGAQVVTPASTEAAPAPRPEPGESPDGRWVIAVKDSNLVLRSKSGGDPVALTRDGVMGDAYAPDLVWSPDSSAVMVRKVRAGVGRTVTKLEVSPGDQVQPKVHTQEYLKPGDTLPKPVWFLITVGDRRRFLIEDSLYSNPYTEDGGLDGRWSPDSREFFFTYNQRGHQRYRILSVAHPKWVVAPATGSTLTPRVVVDEAAETFIDWTNKTWRHWLDATHELIWMSERSGWAHLWLYDTITGRVKNPVTQGSWVVREVLQVDEARRHVWFLASGVRPGQDPYYLHLCRVGLDGAGFVVLTEGDGNHRVEFSPDRRWFLDTWSRVDLPPVTELRRSEDGQRVLELERGNDAALRQAGWTVPEIFVAKARDGVTDIHGVIIKPSRFDPSQKYPVIEEIYAGPQGAFVPKEFSRLNRHHALAELGFVVVQVDGLGTNHRGKKFHDVCWKNLRDSGLPDHIAWMKAAATTRPWMDLTRVGIYGGSAGGQNSTRALLDFPEFYKVGVSDCGCHDNRMDKLWWNEQWLGWPIDESYVRSSNVADAHHLKGKLLLTVGELDSNVDPASTLQLAAALVRAEKEFELLIIPGANHGAGETPFASRRRMDFFVRHLLGKEPGQ